jgi:hypothetical protein
MEDLRVDGMIMLQDTQCAYKRNIEALSRNRFAVKKTISIIQGVSGGIVNILGGGSMDYSE